ncbi:hypothetical protein JCM3765_001116 [Sporobolomyces pararoseus]
MMIPLKQLSIPSTSNSTSTAKAGGMLLLPKGLQHPRFEEKVGGKGGWVMCHHQALGELASKGSYKRLNSQLSMPKNVQNLKEWTLHQLVKRLEQEVEMYCERAKSWPKLSPSRSGGSQFLPVRRVKTVEEALQIPEGAGQIEMVLDLSELNETEESRDDRVVQWKRCEAEDGQGTEIAIWKLGQILRNVVNLPSIPRTTTISTTSVESTNNSALALDDSGTKQTSSSLDSVNSHLDAMISLFERRLARDPANPTINATSRTRSNFQGRETNVESQEGGGGGEIYVFYSPSQSPTSFPLEPKASNKVDNRDSNTKIRIKKDLVDLWISCWRIGLWNGNGWEDM